DRSRMPGVHLRAVVRRSSHQHMSTARATANRFKTPDKLMGARNVVARSAYAFLIPNSKFLIAFTAVSVAIGSLAFQATEPIAYRFSFPEPEHRWMQVEAAFPDLPAGTVEFKMSRSSPGRYSLHDFAKNVYDVHAFGRDQQELPASRPDPYGWN